MAGGANMSTPMVVAPAPAMTGASLIKRHSLLVRITHWVNALCILVLVMSGLQIFNAHPALYIGQKADFDRPVLSMTASRLTDGRVVGETQLLGAKFKTTGVLGLSYSDGQAQARGFPAWATLPSYQDLATGRRWHFFFVWLFAINGGFYLAVSLANRHVWRDLIPSREQIRGIGRSILDHLRLRFDHGRDYNVLQKLTYLIVIFVLLPLVVLTGMTMSPGLDAAFPWLVSVFAGRQTARTIHFICATGIVLFVVIHLVMVLISGVWNNIRSMITGRYAIHTTGESNGH
jgi:thiosulfate reductase cytochrome b subunit